MRILSLDTEYENSPRRLISIAYIISDGEKIIETKNLLVKHNINVFQIDEDGIAFSKHKITNRMCHDKGKDIEEVLDIFNKDLDKVDYIVGHNVIAADISTIRREAIGIGIWNIIWNKLKEKKFYDTIKESKKKFPDIESYSLDIVYKTIFNKEFEDHHNALEDCKTTFKIFKYFNSCLEEEGNTLDLIEMNFPEDEIIKIQNKKICSNCSKNVKNYYIINECIYRDKYQKYTFIPYNLFGLKKGEILCSKCVDNIEIIKYCDNKMVDIYNKNMNKKTFKYKEEFLETKKNCFQYVEKIKKVYLNCPYDEKEICKEKGGKWDAKQKKWYIKEGTNINDFVKWLN